MNKVLFENLIKKLTKKIITEMHDWEWQEDSDYDPNLDEYVEVSDYKLPITLKNGKVFDVTAEIGLRKEDPSNYNHIDVLSLKIHNSTIMKRVIKDYDIPKYIDNQIKDFVMNEIHKAAEISAAKHNKLSKNNSEKEFPM